MTATEELRHLLDERGVEYKVRDMFGKHVFHWGEPLHGAMFTDGGEWTELVVENATPQQAIDATLGRGTCQLEINTSMTAVVCDKCNYPMPCGTVLTEVRYCPNCGRKVVDG